MLVAHSIPSWNQIRSWLQELSLLTRSKIVAQRANMGS